jgi:hypothetical protein
MAEGEFLITITKKTDYGQGGTTQASSNPQSAGGVGGGESSAQQVPTAQQSGSTSEQGNNQISRADMFGTAVFANIMIAEARKFLNYSISNYGNMSGDYSGQANINSLLSVAGQIGGIGAAFLFGGPVGGIIATAGVVSNNVYRGVDFERGQDRLRNEIDYLRDRAGAPALGQGSRATIR